MINTRFNIATRSRRLGNAAARAAEATNKPGASSGPHHTTDPAIALLDSVTNGTISCGTPSTGLPPFTKRLTTAESFGNPCFLRPVSTTHCVLRLFTACRAGLTVLVHL